MFNLADGEITTAQEKSTFFYLSPYIKEKCKLEAAWTHPP